MNKQLSLQARITAIERVTKPLKNIAGAATPLLEKIEATQRQLKQLDAQGNQFTAFRDLTAQSKQTTAALQEQQSKAARLAGEIEQAKQKTKSLGQAHKDAQLKVMQLALEMDKAEGSSESLKLAYKEAQAEASRLGRESRGAASEQRNLTRELSRTTAQTNQLEAAQTKEREELQQLRQNLTATGHSTQNMGEKQAEARRKVEQLNQQLDQQTATLKRVAAAEKSVSDARQRYQDRMQVSASATVVAFGASQAAQSIKQTLTGPIAVAAAFEEQMDKVAAVSRASTEQQDQLIALARDLGARTQFSASQAGQGMQYLAMAGFQVNQIMAAMPGVLDLAKATATDLGTTADISSDILSGFGLSPDRMQEVADVLTAVTTRANTDLVMLGDTMKYVAPIGREAGLSLQETAAMAGLLSNVGIKASQAGTTLRAVVQRLASPTGAAAKQLQNLGIQTKDSAGNMRGVLDILEDVALASEKMGSSDRLGLFKDIFGEEPAAGVAELVKQEGAAGITQFTKILNASSGEAARVAKQMGDNAKGVYDEFDSTVESLQITVGNLLLPTLVELGKEATEIIRKVEDWSKKNPELAKTLMMAGAGLGVLAAVMVPVMFAVAGLNSLMAISSFGFTKFAAGAELLSIKLGLARGATMGLNIALLANPIVLIVAGVLALIAVLGILIYKYFEPLKALMTGFWDGFVVGLAPVFQALEPLKPIVSGIWDMFSWMGSKIAEVFSNFLTPVTSTSEELAALAGTGYKVGEVIGQAINALLWPVRQLIGGLSKAREVWHSLFGEDETEVNAQVNKVETVTRQATPPGVSQVKPPSLLANPTPAAMPVTPLAFQPPEAPALATLSRVSNDVNQIAADTGLVPQSGSPRSESGQPASLAPVGLGSQLTPVSRQSVVDMGGVQITVQAAPGQSTQDIGQEVRRQLENLMAESQRNQNGMLYDF